MVLYWAGHGKVEEEMVVVEVVVRSMIHVKDGKLWGNEYVPLLARAISNTKREATSDNIGLLAILSLMRPLQTVSFSHFRYF